jgi:hemerythrin-like domain-containing protein
MDAIALLKQDHAEVKELFKQVDALGERANATRAKLFAKIDSALEVHTQIEEEIFYPTFKARAEDSQEREEVLEALEEHGIAKMLLQELQELEPSDEAFQPKLSVLMEAVQHHIKEEEGTLFKMARELFDRDELSNLGEQLAAAKKVASSDRAPGVKGAIEPAERATSR